MLEVQCNQYQNCMEDHKVNHSEYHNFPPEPMTLFCKIDSAAFLNGNHSDNKEESSNTVKVQVG